MVDQLTSAEAAEAIHFNLEDRGYPGVVVPAVEEIQKYLEGQPSLVSGDLENLVFNLAEALDYQFPGD